MHWIIKDGFRSKNTLVSTEESILLALNKKQISGVELSLYQCLDGKIVVSSNDKVGKTKISEIFFSKLNQYRTEKNIKNNSIISLEHLLKIYSKYDNNHYLFLNLLSHAKDNKRYIENITKILKKYPVKNLYLKSDSKEIILYLRDLMKYTDVKIGATFNNYFSNLFLDFYVVDDLVLQRLGEEQIPSNYILIQNFNLNQESFKYSNFRKSIFVLVDDFTYFKISN